MMEPEANGHERKRKLNLSSDISVTNEKLCKKKSGNQMSEESQTASHNLKKDEIYQTSSERETDFDVLIKELQADIKTSEERLRKLKMTKMYREKNNLEELGNLIEKWQSVSQQALEDLLELHPTPQPSMTELLVHLQIDFDLIQFNKEDGGFF